MSASRPIFGVCATCRLTYRLTSVPRTPSWGRGSFPAQGIERGVMKRKPEWIEKTKKEIDQALDSVELDPNGWEQGFLQNIKKQLDKKGTLTDPQENKLLP